MKICPKCTRPREGYVPVCPFCGYRPLPAYRSGPEFVEGDLLELDEAALKKLRGDVESANLNLTDYEYNLRLKRCPEIGILSNVKKHATLLEYRNALSSLTDLWSGMMINRGLNVNERYRYFYLKYGVDVLTAKTLGKTETFELMGRIENDIRRMGDETWG